jgi:Protein of unknown function (DUF3052)
MPAPHAPRDSSSHLRIVSPKGLPGARAGGRRWAWQGTIVAPNRTYGYGTTGLRALVFDGRQGVSTTADGAAKLGPVHRLGLEPGMVVQELGWDEDVDDDIRAGIESIVGSPMVDEDYGDVADVVVLWWRNDDGDLVDALVDCRTDLGDGGMIWLLTPKVGLQGHVDPSDIAEAAPTAGLWTTTSLTMAAQWAATKLVTPKSARAGRR